MNIEKFPKVTVILRGYTYSQTRTVVKNLAGTCLGSVEITMNTPGALESIRKISQEFGGQIMVGAGTVLTYEEAVEAIDAGAAFLLSPTVFEKRYWTCAGNGAWCLCRVLFHLRKSGRVFWMGLIS